MTTDSHELTDAEIDALMVGTFGDDATEALSWSRDWRRLADAAYAAGAASVPREPTPEMITAGREAIEAWGANGPVQVWGAMYGAATGVTK